jgi:ABC-type branched-subunit amino acid transport system substrate-binding protein
MKMVAANPAVKPSHASLQGYLSARVLVEAMRKAGKNLSREKLGATLESMKLDFGGFNIEFKPDNHHGSKFIEMSIIGKSGRIML